MDLFFSGGKCCLELNNLIFRGRHYGIELIAVTQRPYGIGRGLTSQTKEFYIFRSNEPCDVKYFRERCGVDVAEKIQTLDRFYYVYYQDYGQRICEIRKDTI
jgi:DNA helicase HerA-like ATPase